MARQAVAIALSPAESVAVATELAEAGFDPLLVARPAELEALLTSRRDIVVAILDGEDEEAEWLDYYALLHDAGRDIAALMVVSPRALDRMADSPTGIDDEYLLRPYSVEALRWRIEAMCIRSQTVDDGSGPVIQSGEFEAGDWTRRATIITVFNPKGGVGKTTVATNLAAVLAIKNDQRVLLVDADTVTGHVMTSLGLEQVRTLAESWRDEVEGGPPESLLDIAAAHVSGMRVIALTANPLMTDLLDPERVANAIVGARNGFDFIIVDLHPSYSALNRAIFDRSDRLLVPVTPDVPALRAAVQLREVAADLGIRERISLIINRANSGISVADMELTIGMPAFAQIRSGGLLFVRAANEGRTVIEMFPREKITSDYEALANRLIGKPVPATAARSPMRMFSRQKGPIRA